MGPGFESPMVHQGKPYGKRRAYFFVLRSGKAGVCAPSGTRTARAGRLASRPAKTPLRGVFRARESPRGSSRPAARGGGRALRKLFAAPSPSGRLQRSRKRSASARGDRSLKTLRRSVFLTRPLPAPNHANPNVLLFEGAFGFVFYLQSMNMK